MKKKPAARRATKPTRTPVATASAPPTAAVVLATRALGRLPPISSAVGAAFAGQTTSAERGVLGAKTKASGVLRDAGAWVPIIESALAEHPGEIPYSKKRFAFYCGCILALSEGIASAGKRRSGAAAASASRASAKARAKSLRHDLLESLKSATRGSKRADAVAAVERRGDQDDVIGKSIDELAAIADAVLAEAEKDEGAAALVEDVLTPDLVAAARAAARTLTTAGVGRASAGDARVQDPPEVNLDEGTVLAEMRVARDAFERAHAKNGKIPRLIPGPEARKVLASHPKGKIAPSPPPSASAPPPNGAPAGA